MGKRERTQLKREEKARFDARVAVFRTLWETPSYVKLAARLEHLNRLVTQAELYRPETADLAMKRFKRLHRHIQRIENAALAAAGLSP